MSGFKNYKNPSFEQPSITIEVVEKKEIIPRDKALEIAVNHLRKQTWADDYIEDSAEVFDGDNVWEVYFKHIDFKYQRPSHGLVAVNKETGEAKWMPLR